MLPGDQAQYDQRVRETCTALGADAVRQQLAEGRFGERKGRIARAWLEAQDLHMEGSERETDRDIAREANRISADANGLAARALRRSTWANIVAILALAVALAAAIIEILK